MAQPYIPLTRTGLDQMLQRIADYNPDDGVDKLQKFINETVAAFQALHHDIAFFLARQLHDNYILPPLEHILIQCLLACLDEADMEKQLFRAISTIIDLERSPPDADDPRLPAYRTMVEDLIHLGRFSTRACAQEGVRIGRTKHHDAIKLALAEAEDAIADANAGASDEED